MNILVTYVRKYLMMNKSSTLLSILSLITASALFFLVSCLCVNTLISFNDSMIAAYGNYHAIYHNVSDEFADSLSLHAKVMQEDIIEIQKKIEVDCFLTKTKSSFTIAGMDQASFDDLKFVLLEGRFPVSENEILVSEAALTDSKISLDLHQKVMLDNQEYEVVGIIENNFFDNDSTSYTLISVLNGKSPKDLYVRYYNQKDSEAVSQQIVASFSGEFESFEMNSWYHLFHQADESHAVPLLIFFFALILLTFIAMNILLIRNCYKNSYANREKHLAILKTVGVTQLQCTTMILYEGLLLLIISLALGIPLGWLLYDILVNILNGLIYSVSVRSLTLGHHYREVILLISVIYVALTSFYFIRKSTKKIVAQNVTTTLQSSDEVEVMDHPYLQLEKKKPILIRLFHKNIRQNHRSYRHLIIGVTAIITLFILMNSLMGYLREGVFYDVNDHNYDVEVIIHDDTYPTRLMTQLKNAENASAVVISESIRLYSSDVAALDYDYLQNILFNQNFYVEVITYSDEVLQAFSHKAFGDEISVEKPRGILINQMYSSSQRRFYNIFKNTVIHDLYYDDQKIFSSLNLLMTNKLITGCGYQKQPQILVSRQLFREIYDQTGAVEHEYHVYFQSNDSASLVRQLNIINDSFGAGLEVVNVQKAFNDGKIFISLIRILSYGYILSLILMGILATSSIASVNFEYRKKEFMLYRALGLRMKDMMILVFVELLYYGIQIFAGSWVLSQTLNYLCYQLYFKSIGLQFFIPENSLLGSIIFFVSAITIFMCYIYIRMRTLRYSLILKNEITMM